MSTHREALTLAFERMDRARNILTNGSPTRACNWGMLDTSDLRKALAQAEQPEQPEQGPVTWKPIKTAPKDASMILVCLPRHMNIVVRAWYNKIHGFWQTDYEGEGGITRPTYFHEGDLWHPIPPIYTTRKREAGMVNPITHCRCDACKNGNIHDSDCAVHNMPAYPNGPCDCRLAAHIGAKP